MNEQKLIALANLGKEEELDIIGIAETNIKEKEGKWIQTKQQGYVSFWSSKEEDKLKGSGIGVLVNERWAKHIGRVIKYSAYLLKIEFFFKKIVIQVWVVYLPPADKKSNRETQRTMIREICRNKINTYTCVTGDFNALSNISYDTNNKNRKNQGLGKPLLEWLKSRDQVDTFRFMNPYKKEYTWQKEETASRIDYIWVGEELENLLDEAVIQDIDMLTGSDHKLIWAKLRTRDILGYGRLRKKARSSPTRRIFLYHKATIEN